MVHRQPPGCHVEGPLLRPLPYWRQRSGGLAMHQAWLHTPVMVEEAVGFLQGVEAGVVLDATFGGGGHTQALLAAVGPSVRVLAIDQDPGVSTDNPRVRLRTANFAELASIISEEGIDELAGACFDLGVSSFQLADPRRGFSYRAKGPLDMRMGAGGRTADELVNQWPEAELASALARFGDARFSRRIAAAIVRARPIPDTEALAQVVVAAVPAAALRRGLHPARLTFQALRIAVNSELESLQAGLEQAVARLAPGGRIVVISYHSLEDRIVKDSFRGWAGQGENLGPAQPAPAILRLLTKRPLRPTPTEVTANPRARSARLRAAEKITQQITRPRES